MEILIKNQESIEQPVREEEIDFINSHINLSDDYSFQVETGSAFNISSIKADKVTALINYKRMNDHRFVNKVLEAANQRLEKNGIYICCVETMDCRKKRILNKFNPIIAYPFFAADFFTKRVVPKVPGLKQLYFALTKGLNRVISLPETLGRIASCGFKIVEMKQIGSISWFVLKKTHEPHYNMEATYGPIIKLKRVAKGGKLISVYKMRTMHPYSEYIQEKVYEENNLKKGGKLESDYRITNWGRVMRKLWLDELPMLANVLKGEIKLVGVRPLSQHYFSLYPKELQKLRTEFTPGLIPPFYVDLPETFDEILESERIYLESYKKHPIRTDVSYFFKSMYNILIKGARSS